MRDPASNPSVDDHPPARTVATQRIIRVALLAGVLTFGAVVWLVQGEGGLETVPPGPELVYLNVALLLAAGAGILIVQRRHAAASEAGQIQTFAIIGWAIGEAPAMFGGVHYLLTGNPIPYLVGVGMLLAAFVMIPVREAAARR